MRDGADLTGMVDLNGYPASTRIVCRERPHPRAQLPLFVQDEGLRHRVFLTDTPTPAEAPPSSSRSVTVGMPPSRATSGEAIPPDSAASPLETSASMPSGSNSVSQRSICWPGPASCSGTANSRVPSPRRSATGCCTSPPASPAGAVACACGYRRPVYHARPQVIHLPFASTSKVADRCRRPTGVDRWSQRFGCR